MAAVSKDQEAGDIHSSQFTSLKFTSTVYSVHASRFVVKEATLPFTARVPATGGSRLMHS